MEVPDIIELMKELKIYDDAENECKRKKIYDRVPRDVQGIYGVYCQFLSKKWAEFRDMKVNFQKIKCPHIGSFSETQKPLSDNCFVVQGAGSTSYCSESCKLYKEDIAPLEQLMKKLLEAEKTLQKISNDVYWSD